jgi:sorbitol/mannitol transport system substrate-binding protein
MRDRVAVGAWRRISLALPLVLALVLAACSGAGGGGGGGGGGGSAGGGTITVATVANPQMQDIQKLSSTFEQENPGTKVKFVILPENELRDRVTQDIATKGGQYDVVTIGTFEAPQWAKNGWIENLGPYTQKDSAYDANDLIPTVSKALSYNNSLYAVPFYGESSFLMYRKDLFDAAGLKMPAQPTWDQVAQFARKLNDPKKNQSGICLRGLPGWGELFAPLNTVVNTFGGRWYDASWNAQLTEAPFKAATQFYVNLVKDAGEPGAPNSGFTECLTAYSQGHAAMWYDATVAASLLEDPKTSKVVGKNGYAPAPVKDTKWSGWLWAWSLAMPSTSKNKDAAWKFMSWATSKEYIKLVGEKLGWARVPPGSRLSTYQIPEYKKAASAFADLTVKAIDQADINNAGTQPRPYIGVQYVGIPEFQSLGTSVSQEISAAIAGRQTVDQALEKGQKQAEQVAKEAGYKKG